MEVGEVKNKEEWESFLLGNKEKTFLQSWNWGEFQKKMGLKIWRLGFYEKRELAGLCLITLNKAKRGKFFLIQHGPVISEKKKSLRKEVLKALVKKIREINEKEGADFVRMVPLWEEKEEVFRLLRKLKFKRAPMHASAYEATWKLNLTPSEEELLMGMRKTTRYLIRRAQKDKDIEIFQSQKLEDVVLFNNLYQEVVKFQHFVPFSLEFLKNEFLAFRPDNQVSLFFGQYKKKIAASAFIIFWSNIGFYHHAALLPEYRKVPISYLILWEAIKEAKKRECQIFDFWGFVDPKKKPNHPWAGPTLFKMGFGGKAFEYLKTWDLPLSKRYWLIYIFEKLRKIKRRL